MCSQFARCLSPSEGIRLAGGIRRVYISSETAEEAKSLFDKAGAQVQTVPVTDLEDVIEKVWPEAIDKKADALPTG